MSSPEKSEELRIVVCFRRLLGSSLPEVVRTVHELLIRSWLSLDRGSHMIGRTCRNRRWYALFPFSSATAARWLRVQSKPSRLGRMCVCPTVCRCPLWVALSSGPTSISATNGKSSGGPGPPITVFWMRLNGNTPREVLAIAWQVEEIKHEKRLEPMKGKRHSLARSGSPPVHETLGQPPE